MPFWFGKIYLSSVIIPFNCYRIKIQEVCVIPALSLSTCQCKVSYGSQEEFTSCKVKCHLPHCNFLSSFSFMWKGMIEGEKKSFDISPQKEKLVSSNFFSFCFCFILHPVCFWSGEGLWCKRELFSFRRFSHHLIVITSLGKLKGWKYATSFWVVGYPLMNATTYPSLIVSLATPACRIIIHSCPIDLQMLFCFGQWNSEFKSPVSLTTKSFKSLRMVLSLSLSLLTRRW